MADQQPSAPTHAEMRKMIQDSPISNPSWECRVTLSRLEVHQLAKVFEYVGNIEKLIDEGFPSAQVKWDQVRAFGYRITRVAKADHQFFQDVNAAIAKAT